MHRRSVSAQFGHVSVLEVLRAAGADISSREAGIEWSPLMVAAWAGEAEVLEDFTTLTSLVLIPCSGGGAALVVGRRPQ